MHRDPIRPLCPGTGPGFKCFKELCAGFPQNPGGDDECFSFFKVVKAPIYEEREKKTNKMQQSDVYYQLLSQHVSGIIMPIFRRTKTVCYCIWCTAHCWHLTTQRPTTASNHIEQNQCRTPYAVTHGLCSPEDGHNDARNMLRQKLIINI